jgi:hypothetical protein
MTASAQGDPEPAEGSRGTRRRAAVVLTALLSTACGAASMKLPSVAGAPAPDAADALSQATMACRMVSSIAAEVGVTGSIKGQRLRARLIAGLAAPASARLEAFAFSQQVFILAARGNDATLLLPRDGRALEHGQPGEVLEALTGLPLDAAELRLTLTGCATSGASGASGRQIGNDWRVVSEQAADMYLRRDARTAPWRLVAVVHREGGRPGWRAEYRDFENGLPHTIRLASTDSRRFDLRLALSQVEINMPIDPAAFEVKIPPATEPITIAELRDSGPLSDVR